MKREALIAARKAAGLSQAELGRRIGDVKQQTIGHYEDGSRQPTPERAARIADELHMPAAVLFPDLAEEYAMLFRPPASNRPA